MKMKTLFSEITEVKYESIVRESYMKASLEGG